VSRTGFQILFTITFQNNIMVSNPFNYSFQLVAGEKLKINSLISSPRGKINPSPTGRVGVG
jgi:hypothetical protein